MVDLSELKIGDIIVFRNGSKQKVIEIELNKNDQEIRYLVMTKNELFLSYKENGYYYNGAISECDIVEIIPQSKEDPDKPKVDLSTLSVGDTVKFRNGTSLEVKDISVRDYTCTFPYLVFFVKETEKAYTKDGYFLSPDNIDGRDIVEIIPKEQELDITSLSKGDLVITRDGCTYEVHSVEPANDSWADYNITLAMYHGGLYTKTGHYQPDCEDPMDIVEVQKVEQKPEQKIIRDHVDLHNIAEGDVVYFEDGSEAVVDDVSFDQNHVTIDFYDFGTFEFNYDGRKFQEDAEVGNIVHVLHGVPEKEPTKPIEQPDPINHPSHYTSGGIECIAAIKASMTPEAYKGYLKGNILKYLWRYESKGKPIEDLKKAQTYLTWLIKEVSSD